MWIPMYQDPGKISVLHAGPTAVNKLEGYFFIKKEKQTLASRALLS